MNSLFRFIAKHQFLLLFLLFQGFSLWLLAGHSYYQRAQFGNLSRGLLSHAQSQLAQITEYFSLRGTNQVLLRENLALKQQVAYLASRIEGLELVALDSMHTPGFALTPARVVNNSIIRQRNYITLNVGRVHGVAPQMGVVTHNGVVGIVVGVSEHYATAISLLNLEMRVSAKLQRSRHFGSLRWDGRDYRQVVLGDIPRHVPISVGDTVVTSGFSVMFPPNVMLGTVASIGHEEGNFHTLRVKLALDFAQLHNVWVSRNLLGAERTAIEAETTDD